MLDVIGFKSCTSTSIRRHGYSHTMIYICKIFFCLCITGKKGSYHVLFAEFDSGVLPDVDQRAFAEHVATFVSLS